jgi:hypothetical protein
MNHYKTHALEEFKAAGWLDENGEFKDEMQKLVCNSVLKLLEVFRAEGHSESSAAYAVKLFSDLALFEPLVPLTGEDWEWSDVSEESGYTLYQNKRCSHVFKHKDGAYDINGIIFYDTYIDTETGESKKLYYTNKDSHVPVTFPYTPVSVYKARNEQA